MLDSEVHCAVIERVSIRTRSFDRVMPDQERPRAEAAVVSIRTRSFDRVMRLRADLSVPGDWFQSAPGLSTG